MESLKNPVKFCTTAISLNFMMQSRKSFIADFYAKNFVHNEKPLEHAGKHPEGLRRCAKSAGLALFLP